MILCLRQLKPYACHLMLWITLLTVVETGYGATEISERRIPLSVAEMADMLLKWWEDAGYQIQRTDPKEGYVNLHAIKDQENWQVDLSPHSALETQVSTRFSGMNPGARQQQFWDHISQYLQNPSTEASRDSDRHIPAAVLSRIESVVCINARSDENNVQFSGFIINTNGLVLCTAHDLENSQQITVTLYNGQEVEAKLLFKDPHVDLSILQIAFKATTAIHLSEGRNLLGRGKPFFRWDAPTIEGTPFTRVPSTLRHEK